MKKDKLLLILFLLVGVSTFAQPIWVTSGAAIGDESTFVYTGNTSMTFDATNDFVNLTSSLFSTVNATQAYSASAWIKVNVNKVGTIIAQYSNASVAADRFETLINASGQFEYLKGGISIAASTAVVDDNTWHHVAFTKSTAGAITLYIDAVADGTGTDNLACEASNTYIGANGAGTANFFDGKIDEVKIWNTELTQTQIFNSMYGTYAPETNIIAVYDFEEGAGTTLTDVTSNTNNGIISGTPVWNINDEIISVCRIKDAKGDILTTSNFGFPGATQIYKVNNTPNNITLATGAGNLIEGHYWGVFPANGTATYDLELMYNGYKTWSDESQLDLAYRTDNSSGAWTNNLNGTLLVAPNTITKTAIASRNEYHLMYEIPPEPGNCLLFNGTDAWVSIPTNTAPNNWSAITTFTVELWINPTANTASHIFENTTGNSSISLEGSGNYTFFLNNTNCGTTGVLTLNKWYHIACVYDDIANLAYFYLDGVLLSTTPYSATSEVFGNTFYLGDRQGAGLNSNARDFPGYIDELRIWNDVRTATEIQDHMHKELSTQELGDATTTGLMAYYNFNHFGNTTSVTDLAGNNNGTLKNDALTANGETTGPIWRESNCFNRWWGKDIATPTIWDSRDNWSKGRLPLITDNIGLHQVKGTPDVVENSLTLATGTLVEVSDFTVGSNATFIANAGEQLTVNDPYTINGTATFKSPASLASGASLITNNVTGAAGNLAGITNVKRHMTGGNSHYFSSPVTNQSSAIFTSPVYTWDDAVTEYWYQNDFYNNAHIKQTALSGMGWTSAGANFTPGVGYVSKVATTGAKIFAGTVNTADVNITLKYFNSTNNASLSTVNGLTAGNLQDDDFDGWNLIGNPYPSAIDWEAITDQADIDNAIYFYADNGTGNYNNYTYYVAAWGTAYTGTAIYQAISTAGATQYIPAMQSFFVKAKKAGTIEGNTITPIFTINNSARVHNNTVNFYKNGKHEKILGIPNVMVRLTASMNGYNDETVVRFIQQATEEYDGNFDAYKKYSTSNKVPQIFFPTPKNSTLAISTMPKLYNDLVVPVGIIPGGEGFCTIKGSDINLENNLKVFLIDRELKQRINLNNHDYTFVCGNEISEKRFCLIFKEKKEFSQYEESLLFDNYNLGQETLSGTDLINIYAFKKRIFIESEKSSKNKVEIFNLLGRKIYEKTYLTNRIEIPMNVNNGIYIVKVVNDKQYKTQKIILN